MGGKDADNRIKFSELSRLHRGQDMVGPVARVRCHSATERQGTVTTGGLVNCKATYKGNRNGKGNFMSESKDLLTNCVRTTEATTEGFPSGMNWTHRVSRQSIAIALSSVMLDVLLFEFTSAQSNLPETHCVSDLAEPLPIDRWCAP